MIEGPYTMLRSSDLDRIRNTLQEAPQTTNVLDVSKQHFLTNALTVVLQVSVQNDLRAVAPPTAAESVVNNFGTVSRGKSCDVTMHVIWTSKRKS